MEQNQNKGAEIRLVSEDEVWDPPLSVILLTFALSIGTGWLTMNMGQEICSAMKDAGVVGACPSGKLVWLVLLSVITAAAAFANFAVLCRNLTVIVRRLINNKSTYKFRNNG